MQVDFNRYGKMEHSSYEEGEKSPMKTTTLHIRCHHRCRSAVLTALLIAVCACIAGSLGWLFYQLDAPRIMYHAARMRVILSTGEVSVWRGVDVLVRGSLGLPSSAYFTTSCGLGQDWDTRKHHRRYCEQLCPGNHSLDEDYMCGVYGRASNLTISRTSPVNASATCHTVSWQTLGCVVAPVEDCYCTHPGYWYGGSTSQGVPDLRQPLRGTSSPNLSAWSNRLLKSASAQCSHESFDRIDTVTFSKWEDVYLLNSAGLSFYFPKGRSVIIRFFSSNRHPLAVHKICFRPQESEVYRTETRGLTYNVCYGENIRDVHEYMEEEYLNRSFNSEQFASTQPLWQIPAANGTQNDMESIQVFQSQLVKFNFTSYISLYPGRIWDDYMDSVTVKEIIPEAFLKPLWLLEGIAVEVHPFVSLRSPMFHKLSSRGSFLLDDNGIPLLVKWHGRACAILDFSNSTSVNWFIERLRNLRNKVRSLSLSLKTVLFDLHRDLVENRRLSEGRMADHVTDFMTSLATEAERSRGIVIIDSDAQLEGMLTRRVHHVAIKMSPGVGLAAETVLQEGVRLSIIAHKNIISPTVLSDANPCRAQPHNNPADPHNPLNPSLADYIESMQTASVLPGMVLPHPPRCYSSPSLLKQVREVLRTRKALSTHLITTTGDAAFNIKPLWWLDPGDVRVFQAEKQVVLGENMIVAPCGNGSRDIYLPRGVWWDALNQSELQGGTWLRNYRVPPGKMPTFTQL